MKGQKGISYVLLCICAIGLLLPLVINIPAHFIKEKQKGTLKSYSTHDIRLEKIILTEAQFSNLIMGDENEFLFNDILYDIKTIEKKQGDYLIEAIADNKETQLNQLRNNIIESTEKEPNKPYCVFMLLYYENPTIFNFLNHNLRDANLIPGTPYWTQHYESIPTPPPDALS